MKKVSLSAALVAVLACAALACATPAGRSDASGVAGTVWAGTDSRGDFYEYHFQRDGSLHYRSPSGFWKNGTWEQDGTKIYMETNKRYSERLGRISGDVMEGRGHNVQGERWTWRASRR